jgi:hypothetical protein
MHDRSLSWFGTGTSGKSGGFKLSNVIKFVYLHTMYITAHFHGLGQTLQRKVVEVKKLMLINFYISRYNVHYRSLSWLGTDT